MQRFFVARGIAVEKSNQLIARFLPVMVPGLPTKRTRHTPRHPSPPNHVSRKRTSREFLANQRFMFPGTIRLQGSASFFNPSPVYPGSMNATAYCFVNTMESEASAIAHGLRRRDPDLLDGLIEQYQHRLLRYLIYLAGNRELAEDLFQETWIRVLERGHQYDGKHEFSTWLYAVARRHR